MYNIALHVIEYNFSPTVTASAIPAAATAVPNLAPNTQGGPVRVSATTDVNHTQNMNISNVNNVNNNREICNDHSQNANYNEM